MARVFLSLSTLLLFGAALPARAAAQPADNPAGRLTLADAAGLVLRQSPALATAALDVRIADARVVQARLRPNPSLSVEAEDLTGSGSYGGADQSQTTFLINQLFEWGGKRAARVQGARVGRDLSVWDYEAKRLDVLRNVADAFVDVLAAQERVALARDAAQLAAEVVPLAQKRVEAGSASPAETARAQAALASAGIDVDQARRELTIARDRLAARWGARGARFDRAEGDLQGRRSPPDRARLQRRLPGSVGLARYGAEARARQAALALAQSDARPDVTLSAGPRVIGRGDDFTLVAGLSVPLPFWNRNQGRIQEAHLEVARVDQERRAAETQAFAALNAACETAARAADEARRVDGEVLPAAQAAIAEVSKGFNAGRVSQLEVLDARRTLHEARLRRLRASVDYHKALAEIDALTAPPSLAAPDSKASVPRSFPTTRRNPVPTRP